MFPHSITVFTKLDDDTYERYFIDGVYWYGSTRKTTSDKGKETTASVKIVMPINKFMGIENGSYVVKGNHADIETMRELDEIENCIVVESIDLNDVGSKLDNVIITGA